MVYLEPSNLGIESIIDTWWIFFIKNEGEYLKERAERE
jgi:hypothetical protein